VSGNELLALGALAAACLFAAGILLRSWRRRRTSQPLVAAVIVLVLGAGAIALALLGVPYRLPVGAAFIAALVAVMLSARSERATRS
jgi:peptidoglycan/LPS O-acetylase OafA/YrhL